MSNTRALWLADVLRAAGLTVVEHDGWKTRGHGDFTILRAVVWHHDGSPEGDSPGVPGFMLSHWDIAAANCWVDLAGRWHLLAAGVSYHAGRVLPGKPGNHESLGVETDHTTGETWSGVFMLDSLRRGTAAILAHLHKAETGLEFHKTICSPVGRKNDPDGLELTTERRALAALLQGEEVTDAEIEKIAQKVYEKVAGDPLFGKRFTLLALAQWNAELEKPK